MCIMVGLGRENNNNTRHIGQATEGGTCLTWTAAEQSFPCSVVELGLTWLSHGIPHHIISTHTLLLHVNLHPACLSHSLGPQAAPETPTQSTLHSSRGSAAALHRSPSQHPSSSSSSSSSNRIPWAGPSP